MRPVERGLGFGCQFGSLRGGRDLAGIVLDLIALFVPANVFRSLVDNAVPGVVLFCIFVGAALVELHIHGSQSLKTRRGVVRKIVQRVRNRFNLSVAEVGGQDTWQRAVLGIAAAGSDRVSVRRVLEKAADFIEDLHLARIEVGQRCLRAFLWVLHELATLCQSTTVRVEADPLTPGSGVVDDAD